MPQGERSFTAKEKIKCKIQKSKLNLKNLQRRKRKYEFANRIGEKREKMDEARQLSLENKTNETENLLVEVVTEQTEMLGKDT